jgi:glycogen operon protein
MKLGATITHNGVEFGAYSEAAYELEVLLFKNATDQLPRETVKLKASQDHYWSGKSTQAKAGWFYVLRAQGKGPTFNPAQWLLDPYAKAIQTPRKWGEKSGITPGAAILSGKYFPKGIIVDDAFDWADDARPEIPANESIIYEAHLRGFTNGGGYLELIDRIPHLTKLGITAIELLPVFEFDEMEYFQQNGPRKDLVNFWGYSTLAFFAPMARFASSPEPGAAVREFKQMVQAMHKAGIEVILDVVFNHTAEGGLDSQTWSFRGLDNNTYYMHDAAGKYLNYSGCGNTFNCNHPIAAQFIVDCLRYWAEEMHVDGFRFDLASILTRMPDGTVSAQPPVILAIEKEPALKKVKLIAEAWDAAGLYQVGHFPGKRFSDWNGKFRDDVRRFWRRDPEMLSPLATRLFGSDDLYHDKSPLHSINFITSHDGFTLNDLVSYNDKHNEANCEKNRDGDNNNFSDNHGVEGPTTDIQINLTRLKDIKNMLATLFLSRGIPMLTAGDEFGRTQQGSNNAYCQDNEISWIDWSLADKNSELLDFTRTLIKFRKENTVLHKGKFINHHEVKWFGPGGLETNWDSLSLGCVIDKQVTLLINNEKRTLIFGLTGSNWNLKWWTASSKPVLNQRFIELPAGSICALTKT